MRAGVGIAVLPIFLAAFGITSCNRSKKRSTGSLTEAQTITLITHHRKLAVKLLNDHGLTADFSIGSIKELDWMVDQDPENARRNAE